MSPHSTEWYDKKHPGSDDIIHALKNREWYTFHHITIIQVQSNDIKECGYAHQKCNF